MLVKQHVVMDEGKLMINESNSLFCNHACFNDVIIELFTSKQRCFSLKLLLLCKGQYLMSLAN